jgi:primosomal protein N' (replication factor Y)
MPVLQDLTIDEIQQIIQGRSAWKVVHSLLEKGLISVYEDVQDQYQSKKEKFVFLTPAYSSASAQQSLFSSLERAPKQLNIWLSFLHLQQTEKHVLQSELLKRSVAGSATLLALCEKGIFEIRKLDVDRLPFESIPDREQNILNKGQEIAYQEIQQAFTEHQPVLLQGITGSGKTHVYCQLISDCLAQGKQALYLLPEIALTPQIIRRLKSIFGPKVGMYHSRFSHNERVEVWQKTLNHEYDVIIGARSALFLPFHHLGLIVVDEEHDGSYKQQDPAPRYQARDCALVLAAQMKVPIIMGSATPSIESYTNAVHKKYALVHLRERHGNAGLPEVNIIDTKKAMKEKTLQGIFSKPVIIAMQEALQDKKQIILFQNRRGYAPFSVCTTCGWVPHCKNCDVSLTYHKHSDQLHCHYCGAKSPYISICQACGGNRVIAKSFGTEKIEEDCKKLFPHARVQRFDWDAMRIKNKYSEIIRLFEKQQIDILVGTQMVVKGLDFEHVRMVVVLSADSLLSYPDFRVNERGFQLLEQVSGRAGRKDKEGKVYVQLFKADHPVVEKVKHHDFSGFYQEELLHRATYHYPPYVRLIRITLRHRAEDTVYLAAERLAAELAQVGGMEIIGPAQPPIARVRNQFLQEILIKIEKDSRQLQDIKTHIRQIILRLGTQKNFTQVQVITDVDP